MKPSIQRPPKRSLNKVPVGLQGAICSLYVDTYWSTSNTTQFRLISYNPNGSSTVLRDWAALTGSLVLVTTFNADLLYEILAKSRLEIEFKDSAAASPPSANWYDIVLNELPEEPDVQYNNLVAMFNQALFDPDQQASQFWYGQKKQAGVTGTMQARLAMTMTGRTFSLARAALTFKMKAYASTLVQDPYVEQCAVFQGTTAVTSYFTMSDTTEFVIFNDVDPSITYDKAYSLKFRIQDTSTSTTYTSSRADITITSDMLVALGNTTRTFTQGSALISTVTDEFNVFEAFLIGQMINLVPIADPGISIASSQSHFTIRLRVEGQPNLRATVIRDNNAAIYLFRRNIVANEINYLLTDGEGSGSQYFNPNFINTIGPIRIVLFDETYGNDFPWTNVVITQTQINDLRTQAVWQGQAMLQFQFYKNQGGQSIFGYIVMNYVPINPERPNDDVIMRENDAVDTAIEILKEDSVLRQKRFLEPVSNEPAQVYSELNKFEYLVDVYMTNLIEAATKDHDRSALAFINNFESSLKDHVGSYKTNEEKGQVALTLLSDQLVKAKQNKGIYYYHPVLQEMTGELGNSILRDGKPEYRTAKFFDGDYFTTAYQKSGTPVQGITKHFIFQYLPFLKEYYPRPVNQTILQDLRKTQNIADSMERAEYDIDAYKSKIEQQSRVFQQKALDLRQKIKDNPDSPQINQQVADLLKEANKLFPEFVEDVEKQLNPNEEKFTKEVGKKYSWLTSFAKKGLMGYFGLKSAGAENVIKAIITGNPAALGGLLASMALTMGADYVAEYAGYKDVGDFIDQSADSVWSSLANLLTQTDTKLKELSFFIPAEGLSVAKFLTERFLYYLNEGSQTPGGNIEPVVKDNAAQEVAIIAQLQNYPVEKKVEFYGQLIHHYGQHLDDQELAYLFDPNLGTQTVDNRYHSTIALSKLLKKMQGVIFQNATSTQIFKQLQGAYFKAAMAYCWEFQNLHGYIQFKVFKAAIQPENHEEHSLQSQLEKYMHKRIAYDTTNAIQFSSNESVDLLIDVIDNPTKIQEFVEKIVFHFSETKKQAFNGGFYITERKRPTYSLPQQLFKKMQQQSGWTPSKKEKSTETNIQSRGIQSFPEQSVQIYLGQRDRTEIDDNRDFLFQYKRRRFE